MYRMAKRLAEVAFVPFKDYTPTREMGYDVILVRGVATIQGQYVFRVAVLDSHHDAVWRWAHDHTDARFEHYEAWLPLRDRD